MILDAARCRNVIHRQFSSKSHWLRQFHASQRRTVSLKASAIDQFLILIERGNKLWAKITDNHPLESSLPPKFID
jgi:hypothetical protein